MARSSRSSRMGSRIPSWILPAGLSALVLGYVLSRRGDQTSLNPDGSSNGTPKGTNGGGSNKPRDPGPITRDRIGFATNAGALLAAPGEGQTILAILPIGTVLTVSRDFGSWWEIIAPNPGFMNKRDVSFTDPTA